MKVVEYLLDEDIPFFVDIRTARHGGDSTAESAKEKGAKAMMGFCQTDNLSSGPQ
jgi:hypothetical protein